MRRFAPTHVWYWRKFLGERKGQPCRIWAHGSNGNLGIEFEDGYRTVAPRYSVRRLTISGTVRERAA